MDITQILLAAQSPDGNLRSAAEGNIKQFQEQNLPNFLLSLSVELSNDERPPESRRLAGIILKNSLDAKDSAKKELLTQQWVSLDHSIKLQIKESLLITLGSSVGDARQTSSQVIAKIASIEIPRREWQDLIAKLLSNMTQPGASAPLKQATLEALGYVCEEIPPEHLEQDQVNAVLTAVVQGMNQTELSSEVRLAAVKALYNALDFAESNFANEMERTFIMKVICDTAVSKEVEIRQAAFECLVAIASTYYVHLDPYMQTIFNLTANAVKGDEEPVALQAVEFWSTICEEEIELQEEYEGSDDANSTVNYRFIEKALPSLVPMLLETLLKQEEDQEQDDNAWNISMSGGTCLGLIARTVGDAVVPLVMPFVEANITKPDWRCREAATFAFGSILDGPSLEKLAPLVQAGLDFLLNTMNDPNSQVKDTTAWTLGRVFELLHSPCSTNPIISNANLPRIMGVLLESSKDVPNVAEKVCGAIYFLAQGYEDAEPASSLLTPYLPNVIAALLTAADRGDMTHVRLRASAYEALNEIVRVSNIPETSSIIGQLLQEIMRRLNLTFDHQIFSSGDKEKQSDLQALLCGVLQVIIQKLSSSDAKSIIAQTADQLMLLFLRVFACHSATVHEEAMLAIGALAYATGPDFVKYMPEFFKYLEAGLQNYEEYQVCSISVGVVGDICRALEDKILPFCDGIMTVLLKDLSNSQLNRSVKPPIFSCFGDIALAIGENFEKYLPYAMPMLQGAAELLVVLDQNDEDMVDYGNQLRRGIFEAYSGILQGIKGAKAQLMIPYAGHLLQFTEAVYKDRSRDESVTKAAVAVLGDLADTLGPISKDLFKSHLFHVEFLRECLDLDDEVRETASWTQGMINQAIVS
ncbi:importin subunit beta-1-like [Triticum dicoccoides]|uniref:importin subunit beta-1-like n=1 Tax=Triticum dicoccoides TaxID=85692 RepID=UPI00188ED754|nr:importin subunit beta-1-like [Triticum dicoccoides]XP_037412961.1 importin subunit beta-1-like [Triticum dicoccoides]